MVVVVGFVGVQGMGVVAAIMWWVVVTPPQFQSKLQSPQWCRRQGDGERQRKLMERGNQVSFCDPTVTELSVMKLTLCHTQ